MQQHISITTMTNSLAGAGDLPYWLENYYPIDTQRSFNFCKTSIRPRRRCIDVLQTLKRRRVSTGQIVVDILLVTKVNPRVWK